MKTFSALLSESWSSFRALWKPLLIGAIIVSAVLLSSQFFLSKKAMHVMGGTSPERMEQLAERMAMGDETAMQEMLGGMGMDIAGMDGMSEEQMGLALSLHMLKNMAPAMGSFALILILLTIVAKQYYLVVATYGMQDAAAAIKRTFGVIFPLIGISIWMFLRSFAWIPIVGIVTAIVIVPRLIFAPLVYLREGGGIVDVTRASNARTRGYWGRIVGYFILFAFTMILVAIGIAIVGKILSVVPFLSLPLVAVAHQLLICFASIFYVRFGEDILSNPLTVATAPVRAFASSPVVRKPVVQVQRKAPVKKAAPKKKPAAQKTKSVTKKKTVAKKKK